MPANDLSTPAGWAAIDAALRPLYGDAKPKHYGTLIPYRAGGPDPLDGISAYFNERPTPHWHLVSYGLTELREKESPNPAVSGFGFELTMRLGAPPREVEPPLWAMGLMQALARYVYTTGKYFEPGHFFDLQDEFGPKGAGFHAVAFRRDPQLPVSKGQFGAFEFLQAVPLLREEVRALRAWNTLGLLDVMGRKESLLISSPGKSSVLTDRALAAEIAERTAREGSSTPRLRISTGSWQKSPWTSDLEVTLAKEDCAELAAVLRGRLGFDRPLQVFVGDAEAPLLDFVPASANGAQGAGATLRLSLSQAMSRKVADDLQSGAGPWKWPELPKLVVQTSGAKR